MTPTPRPPSNQRRFAALATAIAVVVAACGSDRNDATPSIAPAASDTPTTAVSATSDASIEPVVTTRASGLTVTVQEAGTVPVHTLPAPEDVFANSTHIFETENSLVLVDTQFLLPNALDMRAYADDLGKPIDRMFITHAHPDHFLGSEAFADLDLFALPDVTAEIAESGDAEIAEKQADFGDASATSSVVPQTLETGTVEIDGIDYELSEVLDAEAPVQLVIEIPSAGVIAVGDIVYSGVHLIMAGAPDTWTNALTDLQASSARYPLVLPGHGMPTTPDAYDANIAWLAKASELLADGADFETFKSGLTEAFPDRGMPAAIDFVQPFLFPDDTDTAVLVDETATDVTFGECSELAVGSVLPLDSLQAQLPDDVTALSLTAQGTIFDGSDDLGVLIARTLRCEDITVTTAEGDVSDGQYLCPRRRTRTMGPTAPTSTTTSSATTPTRQRSSTQCRPPESPAPTLPPSR